MYIQVYVGCDVAFAPEELHVAKDETVDNIKKLIKTRYQMPDVVLSSDQNLCVSVLDIAGHYPLEDGRTLRDCYPAVLDGAIIKLCVVGDGSKFPKCLQTGVVQKTFTVAGGRKKYQSVKARAISPSSGGGDGKACTE